jgi:hypothetical protein
MTRPFISLGLFAVLLCAGGASRAQGVDPMQEAEALLVKGRTLMATPGKLEEACATLEQSDALVKRGDTLLNLAECHRRQGRTASAWKEFGQAIELAKEAKVGDAVMVAKQRRADLQAKLSFLTIVVSPETGALPGLELTLNGFPVPRDAWGQAVPVDPGSFAIAAKAEGRQPFSATSQVGPDGDKREVIVTLAPLPPKAPPPPAPPPPAPPPSDHAYAMLRVAGASLVLGVGFGIAAAFAGRNSPSDAVSCAVPSGISLATALFTGISGTVELREDRKRAQQSAGVAKSRPRPLVAPLVVPKGGGFSGILTF